MHVLRLNDWNVPNVHQPCNMAPDKFADKTDSIKVTVPMWLISLTEIESFRSEI